MERRFLIVEDNKVTQAAMVELIRELAREIGENPNNYQIVCLSDGVSASNFVLEQHDPWILILDNGLPRKSGLEVCDIIRAYNKRNFWTIMLTGLLDEEEGSWEATRRGANEFLTKPIVTWRFKNRILNSILVVDRFSDDMIDELGTISKKYLWDRLDEELAFADRHKHWLGILLIDFDHFDAVNNQHGHLAGDHVLKTGVERMSDVRRPFDVMFRYGGDEFLMVFREMTRSVLEMRGEKVRDLFGSSHPIVVEGQLKVPITVSIGGVSVRGGKTHGLGRTLVDLADTALYDAKRAGRNCVRIRDFGEILPNEGGFEEKRKKIRRVK